MNSYIILCLVVACSAILLAIAALVLTLVDPTNAITNLDTINGVGGGPIDGGSGILFLDLDSLPQASTFDDADTLAIYDPLTNSNRKISVGDLFNNRQGIFAHFGGNQNGLTSDENQYFQVNSHAGQGTSSLGVDPLNLDPRTGFVVPFDSTISVLTFFIDNPSDVSGIKFEVVVQRTDDTLTSDPYAVVNFTNAAVAGGTIYRGEVEIDQSVSKFDLVAIRWLGNDENTAVPNRCLFNMELLL